MKLVLKRENSQKFKKSDTSADSPMMLTGTSQKLNHVSNMAGPYMDRPTHRESRVVDAIRSHLHSTHLHRNYQHHKGKGASGHCYVASEAAYHLLGGHDAGYKPINIKHEGESHWYLRHTGPNGTRHLDATHDQFETPVPHHEGKGRGFLTKNPSKRAREVIHSVERHLGGV